jgi:hypothetical protein
MFLTKFNISTTGTRTKEKILTQFGRLQQSPYISSWSEPQKETVVYVAIQMGVI